MSIKPPDYDAIELAMWRKNAQEVSQRLSNSDNHILKRIQTYIDRFGYGFNEVSAKIHSDNMFAAHFAKEPRRTSFHEIVAADWLENTMGIEVNKLPASGRDAMYVTSDGMVTKVPKGNRKPSKSLDLMWKHKNITYYAMHKYTKEGGGNQDSQFKEMGDLLRCFMGASDLGICLIVIVDGAYYTERKMQSLKNFTRPHAPLSYAVPIEEVPAIVGINLTRGG